MRLFHSAPLGTDSVIRVLGADPRNGWSTLFVPSISALASVRDIDLVVVDMPCQDVEKVLGLGVPGVLIACDPSDSFLDGLDDRVLTFGWARADLDRIRD